MLNLANCVLVNLLVTIFCAYCVKLFTMCGKK